MKTLRDLFLDQLAEMYAGEQELARALSEMTKLASNAELRQALKAHSYETVGHISKVARVFDCFGEHTRGMASQALSGLLAEGYALVALHKNSPASDAAVIEAVQKLEHFEIAIYGCLRDWARVLNNNEAAFLLEEILDEEKDGDLKLSDLAHLVNVDALGEVKWYGAADGDESAAMAYHGHGHGRRHHGASPRHL